MNVLAEWVIRNWTFFDFYRNDECITIITHNTSYYLYITSINHIWNNLLSSSCIVKLRFFRTINYDFCYIFFIYYPFKVFVLPKAHTCLNLLFMLAKLDLGVRASTFFSLISEMFLCSLGVKQNGSVFFSSFLSIVWLKLIKWLLFSI